LKVKNEIIAVKEYLNELRETNNALLSTKQNEIMKNLTIVSFVVLPLSLIANLFGMNAIHMPIVGQANDFLILILLMIIFIIFTYAVMKRNKWL
jgi:magnesium transporter